MTHFTRVSAREAAHLAAIRARVSGFCNVDARDLANAAFLAWIQVDQP